MKHITAFSLSLLLSATSLFAENPKPLKQLPAANYGKIPLSFEANQGQTDSSVQFLSHGEGYTLFLRPDEAVLGLANRRPTATKPELAPKSLAALAKAQAPSSVVRMKLLGANPHAQVTREDQQITRTNYFLGNDPAKWRTDVPNFGKVRYAGIYPGIDLVYYGNQRQLEHDFVVAPNADPSKITLSLKGAKTLNIDKSTGDLLMKTGQGDLRLLKPITYQQFGPERTEIPSTYKLLANDKVTFALGPYDHAKSLTIDPILVYSTYLGGTGTVAQGAFFGDQGNGIAVDSVGNAYVVGSTSSVDFPVTTGAYQATNKATTAFPPTTVFVAKLNPAGSALVYATFLGGSSTEAGSAIAVDVAGNAFITGTTNSSDFPVTSAAFQKTNKAAATGQGNAFISELNVAGNALVYSTYLGGSHPGSCGLVFPFPGGEGGTAIKVDGQDNAYIAGYTDSPDFPVTPGAFQEKYSGALNHTVNAFVSKLNPQGSALVFSTYLGGSASAQASCFLAGDSASALVVDNMGNTYVAGGTISADFPVTHGAFKTVNTGGNAFITKLNSTGTAEVFSTFLGGTGSDSASAIAVDAAGSVYVAGNVSSPDFPVTPGVLYPTLPGGIPSSFVAKLNPTASALEYSTFFGQAWSSLSGLVVDPAGSAYIVGYTAGGLFPTTPDGIDPSTNPYSLILGAAYLVKLNPAATAIQYATMLITPTSGFRSVANAVAFDSAGNAYLTGWTSGANFPVSATAFQKTYKGIHGYNAFVSKFDLASITGNYVPTTTAVSASPTLINQGQPLVLSAKVTENPGSAPPTGQVSFSVVDDDVPPIVGNIPSGTTTLNASGIATWSTTAFPPGVFTAGAHYLGDSTHLSSEQDRATGSQTTFRVVGPPAKLSARYDATEKTQIEYGENPTLHSAFVTDSAGNALGAVPVHFSGPGLTFNPPIAYTGIGSFFSPLGIAQSWLSANSVGNYIETVAVDGTPASATLPISIFPAPLQVKVSLAKPWRPYGSANPSISTAVAGLVNGDTVGGSILVAAQTAAIASSPAGLYPVTATVTGTAAGNYSVIVSSATLLVQKVALAVSATAVSATYGQAIPTPTAYKITGFVNGDTQAAAVTGSPAMSTTAATGSPVGVYPVNVSRGTLAAANYTFWFLPSPLQIYKAVLTITPNNITIHVGQPVPPLTYTVTGLVNGDILASALTGTPGSNIPANPAKGRYTISLTLGTLTSKNYNFKLGSAILTVNP